MSEQIESFEVRRRATGAGGRSRGMFGVRLRDDPALCPRSSGTGSGRALLCATTGSERRACFVRRSVTGWLEAQADGGGEHRRAAGVDGVDDLGVVDALEGAIIP